MIIIGIHLWSVMPKYFVGNDFELKDETIYHIKRVLRVRVGDEIILCDGNKNDYKCLIKSIEPFRYVIKSKYECKTEPLCQVMLFQSMPKADKFEWIVQKSVELGVYAVVPMYTEHSVKKNVKIDRYQKIAESAAGQSMRGIIPVVYSPIYWKDILKDKNWNKYFSKPEENKTINIAAHEKIKDNKLSSVLHKNDIDIAHINIGLWIGPEGGFSEKEVNDMINEKFNLVSLGPRILRAETAAIAAFAQIIQVIE